MKSNDTLIKVLVDEYGIRTEKELDEAIMKLEMINLLPFCGEIKHKEKHYGRKSEKRAC